ASPEMKDRTDRGSLMSTPAHRARRRVVWLLVGAVAVAGIALGIERARRPHEPRAAWPPSPCVVQDVDARCGTFVVPENRARPNGRTIGLHVVVLPAFSKRASRDVAATYLAGGPGGAATEEAADLSQQLVTLSTYRDIVLVDQRGTGRSKRRGGDVT